MLESIFRRNGVLVQRGDSRIVWHGIQVSDLLDAAGRIVIDADNIRVCRSWNYGLKAFGSF